MPWCSAARSPFASGTTSGIPSVSRNAEDLSTHTAPPATAAGTSSALWAVPTEKKQSSRSEPSESADASSTTSSRSPYRTVDPAERSDANARTCPNPRSASSSSVTRPTAPVAPTTPIRGSAMGAGRLRLVELERLVKPLNRTLDVIAGNEAADLDRRGADDLRPDPERLQRREHLGGDSRMAAHSRADHAYLPEVVARRPLHI